MHYSGLPILSLPTEQQITELVNSFYSRVRNDDLLGPMFADVVGDRWEEHLATMYDFWSTVVLASRRYKGNPMAAHIGLPRLQGYHFERWLTCWKSTAAELLGEVQANVFVKKAEFIAERLLLAIDTHHNGTQPVQPFLSI